MSGLMRTTESRSSLAEHGIKYRIPTNKDTLYELHHETPNTQNILLG